MSISKLFARVTTAAALAWAGGAALGADVAPPVVAPTAIGAAPIVEAAPGGCPTCQGGGTVSGCSKCGKLLGGWGKQKAPFQVNLCPGACFGYFQTQWRKWEDVCPYPYTGVGVSDAARVPGAPPAPGAGAPPAGTPMPKAGELNPPRPVGPKMADPKMPEPKKAGSDLPVVPMPPAAPSIPAPLPPGKFVP